MKSWLHSLHLSCILGRSWSSVLPWAWCWPPQKCLSGRFACADALKVHQPLFWLTCTNATLLRSRLVFWSQAVQLTCFAGWTIAFKRPQRLDLLLPFLVSLFDGHFAGVVRNTRCWMTLHVGEWWFGTVVMMNGDRPRDFFFKRCLALLRFCRFCSLDHLQWSTMQIRERPWNGTLNTCPCQGKSSTTRKRKYIYSAWRR